jgi:hypothetical protein
LNVPWPPTPLFRPAARTLSRHHRRRPEAVFSRGGRSIYRHRSVGLVVARVDGRQYWINFQVFFIVAIALFSMIQYPRKEARNNFGQHVDRRATSTTLALEAQVPWLHQPILLCTISLLSVKTGMK